MNKFFYPAVMVLLVAVGGAAYWKHQAKQDAVPQLKERSVKIGLESEWLNAKKAIEGLIATLEKNPNDLKTKLQLALAYISESRVTGNHAYYDEAALQLLDQILEKEASNYEATCAKATVLLSQHHFAEAKVLAEQAISTNKYSAFGYGLLTDACLELGEYDRAVIAADSMNMLRPDLRSYSRIAYLREVLGNYNGAKEVMTMAVESGYPSLEQTEWCRVQLGHLYEMTGDTANARKIYEISLGYRPNYAHALAGLGRIACIQGRFEQAIAYFKQADESVVDFSFQEALAETYEMTGDTEKAKAAANKVVSMLQYDPTEVENKTGHGHYSDRELALAYLRVGDHKRAVEHAMIEYKRRPLNIDANETLAWCYFKAGQTQTALPFAKTALKTNSQNPVLNWRMGQIFQAAGRSDEGAALVANANKTNPIMGKMLAAKTI